MYYITQSSSSPTQSHNTSPSIDFITDIYFIHTRQKKIYIKHVCLIQVHSITYIYVHIHTHSSNFPHIPAGWMLYKHTHATRRHALVLIFATQMLNTLIATFVVVVRVLHGPVESKYYYIYVEERLYITKYIHIYIIKIIILLQKKKFSSSGREFHNL